MSRRRSSGGPGQDHDAMSDAQFFFGSNDEGQGNLLRRAEGVSDASAHIARLVRQAMMADWKMMPWRWLPPVLGKIFRIARPLLRSPMS